MKNTRSFLAGVAVAAGLVAFGFVGGMNTAQTRPPIVASVDLEKVFNTIEEKAAADLANKEFAKLLNDEVERRKTEASDLLKELDNYTPNTPTYTAIETKLQTASDSLRAYIEYSKQLIEAREAEAMRNIYLHIRETATALAEELNIDIIFLDDTIPDLEKANGARTLQQISARRMVYCNDELNVSEQMIARLNELFKAKKLTPTNSITKPVTGASPPPAVGAAAPK